MRDVVRAASSAVACEAGGHSDELLFKVMGDNQYDMQTPRGQDALAAFCRFRYALRFFRNFMGGYK